MNTHNPFVEVYHPSSKTITPIPAAELAPGMIEAYFADLGRAYWVDARQLADAGRRLGPYRHGSLAAPLRGQVRKIMSRLKDVYPLSFREWEEGFRRDVDPKREIDLWVRASDVFVNLSEHRELSAQQRKDLFQLLVQCMNCPREHVLQTVSPNTLMPELIDEAITEYFGVPTVDVEVTSLPAMDEPDDRGIPLPLKSLEDPAVRAGVHAAAIVLGVDEATGKPTLFYGKTVLEEAVRTGRPNDLAAISFLYDSRADDLERLVAAVRVLKGSCCYEDSSGNPGGACQ